MQYGIYLVIIRYLASTQNIIWYSREYILAIDPERIWKKEEQEEERHADKKHLLI